MYCHSIIKWFSDKRVLIFIQVRSDTQVFSKYKMLWSHFYLEVKVINEELQATNGHWETEN